ncbi:MAG: glycosyltransferase family A protein [Candidatus Zixiibacteriota bacterium]
MEQLTVSVIIPTYNRAHLIERALNSVFGQVQSGDEIIVVDDDSVDNTRAVLERYRDRIRYVKISNGGAGRARNRGIAEARSDLVAFLDSDDEWMPGKLALQRQLMGARPDILFAFSDIAITTKRGSIIRNFLRYWHNDPRSWDEILGPGVAYSQIAPLLAGIEDFKVHSGDLYVSLAQAIYVVTSTTIVRRVEAGDALEFGEDLPMYEDWLCFGRLAKKGKAAYLDIETAWQHAHSGPRLTDADSLVMAITRLKILERLWGLDPGYLAQHEAEYDRVVSNQYLLKARSLISLGRCAEAREALEDVSDAPAYVRLLARLPGWLARRLLQIRRGLRAVLWRVLGKHEPF